MPDLRPFRGVRYSPLAPLKDLVCPPYDIITAEEQIRLHQHHPYNSVRIELPFSASRAPAERYERAARQFRAWLDAGVLVTDDRPSMYVYRQDYRTEDGRRGRVAGVMGALTLEAFGTDAGVLPHERTMPGPIEDRLALIRACPVNISPIYAIYRGGGELGPYFDSLEPRPPDARFADESGIQHRVWAIRAPAETEMLARAIAPGPLVIADGHHRYETAIAYHREQNGLAGGHDAVMCFCVDADSEDLVVLPYHRAIRSTRTPQDVKQAVVERFKVTPLEAGATAAALAESTADHPLLLLLAGEDLLVELSSAEVARGPGGRAAAWSSLDVVALHEVVLPEIFGDQISDLVYTKDPAEVTRLVTQGGWTAGVLLRPPSAPEVIDVARAGERMPQKASYFWPKAVTGLVFRSLR